MNEAQQQQQHPQQPGGPMAQPPAYGGAGMYGAPPPVGTTGMNMQPNAPPGGMNGYGAPPQYGAPQPVGLMGQQPPGAIMGGMMQQPGALVPVAQQPNPYANMVQQPQQPQQPLQAPPSMSNMYPPNQQPPMMQQPNQGMMPPAPSAAPPQMDPWGAPPAPPVGSSPPMPQQHDNFGQPVGTPSRIPPSGPPPGTQALVPAPNTPNDDPFGIFGGGGGGGGGGEDTSVRMDSSIMSVEGPPHPFTQEQVLEAIDGGDPWSEMGFPAKPPTPPENPPDALVTTAGQPNTNDDSRQEGELPPGGEWYDARIFTPTLGVMFFKPQELTDSLFLQTDRPVVAFIVEGSSARAAGVELGHCLLKVNGIDVRNPKEASRLIKEGPRPLPLLFYVPDTQVVVAEGEHMVKYDTRETGAPNSAKDWKPKYCVIGGIIAQPWMMNMYRSKSEYDIAVIETQARRPVSVKVKQFSLQGARIQNDRQGPQMVKYKNKLHPWKYVVVLPVSRNPIKISSPNLGQLKPVHEGIRRVLMAQQG